MGLREHVERIMKRLYLENFYSCLMHLTRLIFKITIAVYINNIFKIIIDVKVIFEIIVDIEQAQILTDAISNMSFTVQYKIIIIIIATLRHTIDSVEISALI